MAFDHGKKFHYDELKETLYKIKILQYFTTEIRKVMDNVYNDLVIYVGNKD